MPATPQRRDPDPALAAALAGIPAHEPAAGEGRAPRVLLVDDERSVLATLAQFLRDEGYEVLEAQSAEDAGRLLEAGSVDVVVVDILLPGMDGKEYVRLLHSSAHATVNILISGHYTPETLDKAILPYIFDFLPKPVTRNALLRAVGNAYTIKRLHDKNRQLAELSLRQRIYHEQVLDAIRVFILETDLADRILYANHHVDALFGAAAGLQGRDVYDALAPHVDDVSDVREYAEILRAGLRQQVFFKKVMTDARGSRLLVSWTGSAWQGSDGRVQRIVYLGEEISAVE